MRKLIIVVLLALICGAFATEIWNPCVRCMNGDCSEAMKKTCESYKRIFEKNPSIRFDNEETESESDFSLSCTQKCAEYWVCLGKGAWGGNTAQCSKPAGCECTKFFWQKDEAESDFLFKRKPKKQEPESDTQFLAKLLKKLKEKKQKKQQPAEQPESDKINLACTAECAMYWTCRAKGDDHSKCIEPTGCQCNKFWFQKDAAEEVESEKIDWKKVFTPENIKKAVDVYNIIRNKDNVVESDAEAEFFKKLGGLVKKVAPVAKKGFDIYKKAKGFGILADAEAEQLNIKDLIQKIKEKIRARKEKKQKKQPVETEADAEFFKKLGGLVKKAAPIAKKGFDIYKKAKGFGILSEKIDWKKVFTPENIKKAIEIYKILRNKDNVEADYNNSYFLRSRCYQDMYGRWICK